MKYDGHFLYRYRHLNGQHRDWTKRIITDAILHFANPKKFNDPFDCKVNYRPSFSEEELKHQHLDRIKRCMPLLNRDQRRAKVAQHMKALNAMGSKEFLRQMNEGLQNDINKIGVLSLSGTYNDILMWSHYADGHTGLCLKFEATKQTPFFGSAMKVDYLRSYPDVSFTSTVGEKMDAFLLAKAIDWGYEDEYRIIDHDHGAGDKDFPARLLAGVILGARMDPKDKEEVAQWVHNRGFPTELIEAHVVPGSFSLEFRPYDPHL